MMADIALSLFWVLVIVFILFVIVLLVCAGVVIAKITKDAFWDEERRAEDGK